MSIKISFMHYRSYITWTRVKSAVAFEEFDMVYLIWLLVSFQYHCQSFSICKRSALAKIQGGCGLQPPPPPPVSTCLHQFIDIYNSEITVLTTQSTAQRQKSQGKGDVRVFSTRARGSGHRVRLAKRPSVPTHLVFLNLVVRRDTLNQVFAIRTILSAFLTKAKSGLQKTTWLKPSILFLNFLKNDIMLFS